MFFVGIIPLLLLFESCVLRPPAPPLLPRQNHIVVDDFFSIQGLDTLWEAFLRSANPAVEKDAGDLLVQLHLRPKESSQRVWRR